LKIYLGKQTPEHKGDTSRELIDMWEESNLCEVIRNEVNDVFIWANEPNDVLLYEYDRFDVYPFLPHKWKLGLFGGMQCYDTRATPWTYWARRPRLIEAQIKAGVSSYEERSIKSVFLGKIENPVQQFNRTRQKWSEVVEKFNLPQRLGDSLNWEYSQSEYLDILNNSRFGLCLAGYGPKCNREIEYFGLGVVPIVTPEVDMTYFDPIFEDHHYFKIETSEEFAYKVNSISEKKWKEVSSNIRNWYEKNCSREGSFKLTEKIINERK
jgi:hypothetical protein